MYKFETEATQFTVYAGTHEGKLVASVYIEHKIVDMVSYADLKALVQRIEEQHAKEIGGEGQ